MLHSILQVVGSLQGAPAQTVNWSQNVHKEYKGDLPSCLSPNMICCPTRVPDIKGRSKLTRTIMYRLLRALQVSGLSIADSMGD